MRAIYAEEERKTRCLDTSERCVTSVRSKLRARSSASRESRKGERRRLTSGIIARDCSQGVSRFTNSASALSRLGAYFREVPRARKWLRHSRKSEILIARCRRRRRCLNCPTELSVLASERAAAIRTRKGSDIPTPLSNKPCERYSKYSSSIRFIFRVFRVFQLNRTNRPSLAFSGK